MDGGAWWATVHRVTKSQTQLSDGVQKEKMLVSVKIKYIENKNKKLFFKIDGRRNFPCGPVIKTP